MIEIPAFIVWLSAIGTLFLVGGLIHSVYRLGVRVAALETSNRLRAQREEQIISWVIGIRSRLGIGEPE